MEFRDLKKQYSYLKSDIDAAIEQVLLKGIFIGGEPVEILEKRLAEYVGVKHCITCANGTDALQLALMSWNIGPGDAVFVPDFTFFSTAEVVASVGATPVFVDVDEETFNIDVDCLKKAVEHVLEERKYVPKAIIPVDLFGQPADYKRIREIALQHDLWILEDGAQGFGGSIEGKMACSFGDISTTSFFPAKPLGCYGDGGAIFTDNDECADLIRSLKVHGKGKDKYDNVRIGVNSRLDTIQAAILLTKLDNFINYEIGRCNEIANLYTEGLAGIVKTPVVKNGYLSSWAQYTVKLDDDSLRAELMGKLKSESIPSVVYYSKPLHEQGAFSNLETLYVGNGVTGDLCARVLSLPMHPYLTDEEVNKVINTMKEIIK